MQDDVLFETFSCEECLAFAARLRLSKSEEKIKQRVEEVIQNLNL
jgi:ABC-type multidrug transport system ATPase subunit